MKRKNILLLTIAMVVIQFNVSAQFLDNLGKRVENKVEETITRKTEDKAAEKTDDAMDGVFNSGKKKKKKDSSSEEVKTQYLFNFSATIVIESKEDKSTNEIQQSYGDGYILSDMDGNKMIQDFASEKVIILDEKNKTASEMSMKWMDKMMESLTKESKSDKNAKMVKTGRTKKIIGYTCYEYVITSDDGKTEVWFAPNVPFDYSNVLKSMAKVFGGKSNTISKGKGYVMEMTSFDQKGKEKAHMFVKAVSEKIFNLNLNDYLVSKMM